METTTMSNNRQPGCLVTLLAVILMAAALAFAGRADYNEEVISEMGCRTYRAIEAYLGDGATETDIVEEYMDHRDYWRGDPARDNPPRGALGE